MSNRILIPLSADPIHFGHLELVKKALLKYPGFEVVVVILDNPGKTPLLGIDTRILLARNLLSPLKRVRVVSTGESLPDIWARWGSPKIIRGFRDNDDWEYETKQIRIYHSLRLIPEGNFDILSVNALRTCSSSAIKAAVSQRLPVEEFCPANVEMEVYRKLHNQIPIGVAGPIASGKSYLCEKLQLHFNNGYTGCEHIEVDDITRFIWDSMAEASLDLRSSFAEDGVPQDLSVPVPRHILRKLSVERRLDAGVRDKIHRLVETRIRELSRRAKAKFLLIEWALLVEMGLARRWCFNNVIVVDTPEDVRRQQAHRRIDPAYLQEVNRRQHSAEETIQFFKDTARGGGDLFIYEHGSSVKGLAQTIRHAFL